MSLGIFASIPLLAVKEVMRERVYTEPQGIFRLPALLRSNEKGE